MHEIEVLLQKSAMFRRLSPEDRKRVAAAAQVRNYDKGQTLFSEGDAPEFLYTIVTGRVKVYKMTARGTDIILEIFGEGESVGAVAVYEGRPYPASAMVLEPTVCVLVDRHAFFTLLETQPTLVRGLLSGLSLRLVELTNRLAELTGGRMEARFARLFLKMASDMGQKRGEGLFIPMPLSRQELADMTGTTIETAIRIMSRWGKQHIVQTESDGFLVKNPGALESLSQE
jgi:CRP/FNR family transcriptional regulator